MNDFIHVLNDLNCICILYLRKCWDKTWVDIIDGIWVGWWVERCYRPRGEGERWTMWEAFSQTMAPSFSRVWMTTTDYSRQSIGTLAGSQPVGVVNNVFTRCTLNLGDHADLMPKPWRLCRLSACWVNYGNDGICANSFGWSLGMNQRGIADS